MIYPEQVLKQKFEEIGLELDRIRDVLGKHKPDEEMGRAIVKPTKRQKDLADAINILRDASTVDESGDTRPIIKAENKHHRVLCGSMILIKLTYMGDIIKELSKFSMRELKIEIKRRTILEREDLINKTFDIVCKYYETTRRAVTTKSSAKSRGHGMTNERQCKRALSYIFHHEQGYTAHKTGDIMNRAHSTCTISANKALGEIGVSPKYKKEIESLIKLINE